MGACETEGAKIYLFGYIYDSLKTPLYYILLWQISDVSVGFSGNKMESQIPFVAHNVVQ